MGYRLALVDDRFSEPAPKEITMEAGGPTTLAVAAFLQASFDLYLRKQGYGNAWRSLGALGNFVRIDSKVARLRNMLWFPNAINRVQDEEPHEDTLMDLAVLAAFMFINLRTNNMKGEQ